MTDRTARLDELLREEISAIIGRDLEDPRIGFVTVTKVEVAADLRHANVWVSVIGTPDDRQNSLRALGKAMPFIRARLGALRLRRIPELHMREDDSALRGTRVLRIIDGLERGEDPFEGPVGETLPTPGPPIPPAEPARPKASRTGPGRRDPRARQRRATR